MIIFAPLLLIAVFVGLWYYRRGSKLTRVCRWRAQGDEGTFLCVACGAKISLPKGQEPNQCFGPTAR